MERELKKCPFCGNQPLMVCSKRYPWWPVKEMKPVDTWTVCCIYDGCIINRGFNMYYRSEDDAAEAWNRRYDDDQEIQEVPGHGDGTLRKWQREIMDRDRDLQGGSGSADDRDRKEQ